MIKYLQNCVDAGMVGNYGNARIFVQNTSSGVITGVQNSFGIYANDEQMLLLDGTTGVTIQIVLAWSTRALLVEVVTANGSLLYGFNAR
jgi:hypothetical protein